MRAPVRFRGKIVTMRSRTRERHYVEIPKAVVIPKGLLDAALFVTLEESDE